MATHIRPERPADAAAVRAVYRAAFPTPFEADLVDALRPELSPWRAFVAERDGEVVGHLLFTPVSLEPTPAHESPLVGLGPMAVHPDHQRSGIGSALADGALAALSAEPIDAVVVLGHPEWYPKFGFRPAKRFGLRPGFEAPESAFMALELVPGALLNVSGKVNYDNRFFA